MNFAMRRWRRFFWNATRGPREKTLARLRAHVVRALAKNFTQVIEHAEGQEQMGAELLAEIRASAARHQEAEQMHRNAELRHQEAQTRAEISAQAAEQHFRAAEERYHETITRYEQTLADYRQKIADYHQTMSESNLLAEGVIREMSRLRQQVDELAEAVDSVNDTTHPETDDAPVTLKYRAA